MNGCFFLGAKFMNVFFKRDFNSDKKCVKSLNHVGSHQQFAFQTFIFDNAVIGVTLLNLIIVT